MSDAATTLARAPVDEPGLIEEARERRSRSMSRRELVYSLVRATLLVVVAVTMAVTATSSRSPGAITVALLIVGYAIAWNVEFETESGSAVPIYLALVPMFFLLPVGWVPLAAAVAGAIPEFRSRHTLPRRVLGSVGSTWPTIGAAAVLLIAPEQGPTWTAWTVYLLAGIAHTVVDTAMLALHNRVIHGVRSVPWRAVIVAAEFDALFAPVAFLGVVGTSTFRFAFLIPLALIPLASLLTRERASHVTKTVELSHAYRGTALLLGTVIDADDGYTGFHSRGVVDLAVLVARELRLPEADLRRTEFAALLHDVGKIRIPKEIINKPGPLTPDEWTIIRRHPGEGAEMLEHVGGFLSEIGAIVRHHHEKWDGTGYPDGLAGEAIPKIARIVAACDAFSAITTDRAYREGRSVEHALGELRAHADTQFDPSVVVALCAVMEREDGVVPTSAEHAA